MIRFDVTDADLIQLPVFAVLSVFCMPKIDKPVVGRASVNMIYFI